MSKSHVEPGGDHCNLYQCHSGALIALARATNHHIKRKAQRPMTKYFRQRKATTQSQLRKCDRKLPQGSILISWPKNPPLQRGRKTDAINHTFKYPHHLPNLPEPIKQRTELAHSWHIRLNHAHQRIITDMEKMDLPLGLPKTLSKYVPSMN